jgi:hypothetical protein
MHRNFFLHGWYATPRFDFSELENILKCVPKYSLCGERERERERERIYEREIV